jgi:hypothetical protein
MWMFLLACQHRAVTAWETGEVPRSELRVGTLAVAPVVLVSDVPAPPLPALTRPGVVEAQLADASLPAPTELDAVRDAPFLRNEFVGNVRFGGGFVRAGEVALEVRARLMEFSQHAGYAELGQRWLADTVEGLLYDRKLRGYPAPPLDPLLPVERVPSRGVHSEDGHDNVNLPRTQLVAGDAPGPIDAMGADYLLVPYLRSYTTHNGGWFIGQQYGCMAGARVEVLVALYDARTGEVRWSLGVLGRHLEPRQAQASTAEIDQYLLWAEDQAYRQLRKHFLR